ncbi:MAG: type II toxin-antitoxin system HicA family toxin [Planctomycetaceae bacterium]|nr:type II toxin-antitoxin system HicA family toxin [Planctomycetaceae bacterium]
MSSVRNILADILLGSSDQSLRFDELCRVVRALGFDERIRGSHHIFTKENIDEIINLQPKRGLAKPYQVRQVRQLIHKYRLELP